MNEKKDMKTCIRPCVLMINECDKRYIIFKIFFTLIQGLLPATFIIIMQKIINLIQKKADVREILLYTCMYLVLLLLENINGNIEEFYTSKFSLKFNNSINLQILEKSTKLELVDYENPETYDFINRAKSQNGSSILAYVGDALDVVKQFVMLGSTIAILINLKWWIVVVVLIFPLIRSLITYAIDKKWFDIRIKRTKKERKIWYINYLLTAGNAFKEIKLYGVAANLIGKFKKMTGEIIEQDKKMLKNIFFISLGYDLLELCFSGIILFYTINLGINLMQIGTKEESQYYGFYPMPEFMKNHENSEKDKILLFNRYLKKLEEVKKPDIILIGIPGELYAPSEKYIANLGITAYEIFLSVMPDILLVLLPYAEYREEDYESIRKSIIQKYGVNPDYLIPTNLRLQLDETETYQKERYLTIVEPDNEEDADLYESNYIEKITDDILKKLTINGQIKSI